MSIVAYKEFIKSRYYTQEFPFHLAVIRGDLEEIKKYLQQNPAYLNSEDGYANTPLQCAVILIEDWDRRYEVVKYLIEKGADTNRFNESEENFFRYAWRHEKKKDWRLLDYLFRNSWNVDLQGKRDPPTLLWYAVQMQDAESAKELLEMSADANENIEQNMIDYMLRVAIFKENLETTKLFLSYNANVNDSYAIFTAITTNSREILQVLFDTGAVDLRGYNFPFYDQCSNLTRLFEYSLRLGFSNSVEFLLENGVDLAADKYCHLYSAYNNYKSTGRSEATVRYKNILMAIVKQVAILMQTDRHSINDLTFEIIRKKQRLQLYLQKYEQQVELMKITSVTSENQKFMYFDFFTTKGKSLSKFCNKSVCAAVFDIDPENWCDGFIERVRKIVRRGLMEKKIKEVFQQRLFEIFKSRFSFEIICHICNFLELKDLTVFRLRNNLDLEWDTEKS